MEWLLVLVGLLDVFFTVLHYDGFLSSRLYNFLFDVVCLATRPLPRTFELCAELRHLPPFPCREIWARRNPHNVFGPYPVGWVSGHASRRSVHRGYPIRPDGGRGLDQRCVHHRRTLDAGGTGGAAHTTEKQLWADGPGRILDGCRCYLGPSIGHNRLLVGKRSIGSSSRWASWPYPSD